MTALAATMCAAAVLLLPGSRPRVAVLRTVGRRFELDKRTRTACSVVAVSTAGLFVVFMGGIEVLVAAVIVGTTLWTRRRTVRLQRLHRREVDSLTAGLDTIVGELRVGSHPAVASAAAASECVGTVATAFTRAAGRARLGGTAHDGLRIASSPVSTELAIVAGAWQVADDHGLALGGLLAAARGDMVARSRFRDRTHASLAGARATGTVLACLPVVGVGLGQAMGAAPLSVLFGGGFGGILLIIGAGLACAGLLWTDAITDKVCR